MTKIFTVPKQRPVPKTMSMTVPEHWPKLFLYIHMLNYYISEKIALINPHLGKARPHVVLLHIVDAGKRLLESSVTSQKQIPLGLQLMQFKRFFLQVSNVIQTDDHNYLNFLPLQNIAAK